MPSKYKPQRPSWREDLYKGIYSVRQRLSNNKKLCYQDDHYCEFSRRTGAMGFFSRWLLIFIISSYIILSFSMIVFFSSFIITENISHIDILLIFSYLLIILLDYIFFQLVLYNVYSPEDCPIRLNRKTGKVYIYDHFMLYAGSWAFFKRSPFRAKEITVKEFDWSDIQAVMASISMPIASGGMVRNYRIECVVCKPGTNQIVDHFLLSTDSSLCYDEWMWINSYMAFSDKNLDKTITVPESLWARKVVWPIDIDRKSKAASLEEYEKITICTSKN